MYSRFELEQDTLGQIRRVPMGQLPLERDVHHADPRADHGQYRGISSRPSWVCC